MYATSQSEKLSLQRQIDDKSDELVKYSVMKTLIQDKEEIDELYEYVELLEIEHNQNIQKINNKYS
jgi:phosphopantetheine adenylyltransferase